MNEADWREALMAGQVLEEDYADPVAETGLDFAPVDEPWVPPWAPDYDYAAEDVVGTVPEGEVEMAFTEDEAAMSPEELAQAELSGGEEPYTFEEAVVGQEAPAVALSPEAQAAQSRLLGAEEGADVFGEEQQRPQLGPDDQVMEPGFVTEMRREQWEDENFHNLPYPKQAEIAKSRVAKEEKRLDLEERKQTLESIKRLEDEIKAKDERDKKIAEGRERERQKREELLTRDVEPNIPLGSQIAGVIAAAIEGWLKPGGENGAAKMLAALAQESVRMQEADINRGLKSAEGQMSLLGEMERASNGTFESRFASQKAILDLAQKHIDNRRTRLQKGGTLDMAAKMTRASLEYEKQQLEEKQRREEEKADAEQRRKVELERVRGEEDVKKANVTGEWGVKREKVSQYSQNFRQKEDYKYKLGEMTLKQAQELEKLGITHSLGMVGKHAELAAKQKDRELKGQNVPWNQVTLDNPNAVEAPVGYGGEVFLGVLRDPDYSGETKVKIRDGIKKQSEVIRQLDKLMAIERVLGSTYGGIGAAPIGSQLRMEAEAIQTDMFSNYVKALSGAAVSKEEFTRLEKVVPKIEGWLDEKPLAARKAMRENLVSAIKDTTVTHLIRNKNVDVDKVWMQQSYTPVKGERIGTYLARAAGRTNDPNIVYTPEQRKEFILQGIMSTGDDRHKAGSYMADTVQLLRKNVAALEANGMQDLAENEKDVLRFAESAASDVYGTVLSASGLVPALTEGRAVEGKQPRMYTDWGDALSSGMIHGMQLTKDVAGVPGTRE